MSKKRKTSLPCDQAGVDGHKTLEQFILFKSDQAFYSYINSDFTLMRYLWPFLHTSCYLPICFCESMAIPKHRCGNQARMVKRSLPVPADTLVWPCWAQTTRKSLNCVCCIFLCLSGRNKPFWGSLHGLNFISLLAEQNKPWPDCLLVSNQAYTFRKKTRMKVSGEVKTILIELKD